MALNQLPMFGITLISVAATRGERRLCIEFRKAGSGEEWALDIPADSPGSDKLSRPGACFALVELASVGQVASRGKY
jgi:hypothetical protein